MAIYVYDNERNLIVHAVNTDGTVETDLPLFDVNDLVPVPRTLVLQRTNFSVAGVGNVSLEWEGTPNFPLLFMGGGGPGELDFKRWGGVPNQAIDPTGNVLLSTIDFAAGSGYTLTMEFTKNPITDPNMLPPDAVTGATATSDAVLQSVLLGWTMPATPTSTIGARIYRNTVNNFATAKVVGTMAGAPGAAVSFGDNVGRGGIFYYWIVGFNAVGAEATPAGTAPVSVNMLRNAGFRDSSAWTGSGTQFWSISGGIATKAPGLTAAQILQPIPLTAGHSYTVVFTVSNFTAGTVRVRLSGDTGTPVEGTQRSANGTYTQTLVATAGNNFLGILGSPAFGGSVDNVSIKEVIV